MATGTILALGMASASSCCVAMGTSTDPRRSCDPCTRSDWLEEREDVEEEKEFLFAPGVV